MEWKRRKWYLLVIITSYCKFPLCRLLVCCVILGVVGVILSFSVVSILRILRIDTTELHRVYDNILQHAQKCIDLQGDHFQHLL